MAKKQIDNLEQMQIDLKHAIREYYLTDNKEAILIIQELATKMAILHGFESTTMVDADEYAIHLDEHCRKMAMLNNKKAELLDKDLAFDNEIMQKILPRIQGSSTSIKEMLCELFKKCAGDYTGLSQASVSEQMQAYIETKDCKYRKSAEKICYMMRRFEEDGFTSYWL